MAHLTEGTLRRMVDDPDAPTGTEARHFETCPECKARYETVAGDARAITSLMAAPELKVDVASAFNRVRSAPAARPRFGFRLPVFRPGSRPMVLAFATTLALVALVVTAIAEGGTILAPTTVSPVPVTVADMQSLSQLSQYGALTWTTRPNLQIVTSADAAQSISGLKPPTVAKLPSSVSPNVTYAATPKAVAVFTFSKDKAAAAASGTGKNLPPLPAGMDGAQLTVTLGPAVAEIYGNLTRPSSDAPSMGLPQLVIVKSNAPVATSTQVSVKQLSDYLLSVPGISTELTNAIKALGTGGTTLPVPVPVEYATSSRVKVKDGGQDVDGVGLGDNTGVGAGVIWISKSGLVYAVAGTIKLSDALEIANHLT